MTEYHKIQSLFKRDPRTNHRTFLADWVRPETWEWTKPEFKYLRDAEWEYTEKVDGTNIRVIWEGNNLRLGGRTDRAQIPATLIAELMGMFETATFEAAFPGMSPDVPVVLYGEGYGAKIQSGGGRYIPDGQSFILFDVTVGGMWLRRSDVNDVAKKMGIKSVPIVGRGTLVEAVRRIRWPEDHPSVSLVSHDPTLRSEGIVLRPTVELLDRRGQRIITKLKYRDFEYEFEQREKDEAK